MLKKDIRRLTALGLAVALALFFLARLIALPRAESYTPSVLLSGGWGSGPGEFGIQTGSPESRRGPASFSLDADGNVYITDPYNDRIQVFDRRGGLLRVIPVDGAGEGLSLTTVDSKGNLAVVISKGEMIVRLSPEGKHLETIHLLPEAEERPEFYVVEDLQNGENGHLYLQEAILYRDRVIYRIRKTVPGSGQWAVINELTIENSGVVKPDGLYLSGQKLNSFLVDRNGRLYLEGRGGDRVRQIDVVSVKGKTEKCLWVNLPGDEPVRQFSIVGVDHAGRVYLGTNIGTPEEKLYRIEHQEMGAPAEPVQLEPVPAENLFVRVDRQGNIYLLQSSAAGVQLVKYTLRSRLF